MSDTRLTIPIFAALILGACGSVNSVNDQTVDGGDGDGDGDGDAAVDAPADANIQPAHVVFVSSTTFGADVNGRDQFDVQCQMLAASANLDGEFRALLHIRSNPLDADDIAINGPVANMAGEIVALDETEFYSGTLRANNAITESGGEPADTIAWIGVPEPNAMFNLIATCGDWGSVQDNGGQVNVTTNTWLRASSTGPCTLLRSIQCISF